VGALAALLLFAAPADAGSPRVYISGATDPGWNDDDLNAIKSIPAGALEAVVTNPVVRG
jgi:hypothetical protein